MNVGLRAGPSGSDPPRERGDLQVAGGDGRGICPVASLSATASRISSPQEKEIPRRDHLAGDSIRGFKVSAMTGSGPRPGRRTAAHLYLRSDNAW
jgi:hypothetical protein